MLLIVIVLFHAKGRGCLTMASEPVPFTVELWARGTTISTGELKGTIESRRGPFENRQLACLIPSASLWSASRTKHLHHLGSDSISGFLFAVNPKQKPKASQTMPMIIFLQHS